jgi:hypothetical protein
MNSFFTPKYLGLPIGINQGFGLGRWVAGLTESTKQRPKYMGKK